MTDTEVAAWWDKIEPLLHRMGPLSDLVTYAGMGVTAGWAILSLIGVLIFAPPIEKADGTMLARVLGVLAAVMLTGLYWWNGLGAEGPNLIPYALATAVVALLLFFAYLYLRKRLVVTCEGDPDKYLGGFTLLEDAKSVLAGNFTGLPAQRQIPIGQPPTSVREYFCNSGRDPDFIWTDASQRRAWWCLVVVYALFALTLVGALAAAALELHETEVEVETVGETTVIRLPSEMLFAFDSAEITEGAAAYLTKYALMIKQAGAITVEIAGHTDGFGGRKYNQKLSERRAAAVRDWLEEEGGLSGVVFHVSGRGTEEPRFEETDAEGNDRPEARQANRRVEIKYGGTH